MTWMLSALFIAVMTVTQIFLGILGLVMIGSLTGGRWFETAEDELRNALRYFPLLSVFFLPFLWFLPHVHLENSGVFLNPLAFDLRAVTYWAAWNVGAWRLQRASGRLWPALGLLVLLFTMTFSAMDWIMMLDRQWVSSGFGVIFISDSLMAGIAFMILTTYRKNLKAQPIGDFANLLLMSTLIWIYMHYMEYLVIWQGQIPREMHWYDVRFESPYLAVVWGALLLSFVVPFPILLFKKLKHDPVTLLGLAYGVLIARMFETHALIEPTQARHPWAVLGVASLLCVGAFRWIFHRAGTRG